MRAPACPNCGGPTAIDVDGSGELDCVERDCPGVRGTPCERCGEPMYEQLGGMAEVYDPRVEDGDSIVCHIGCIPGGWELA